MSLLERQLKAAQAAEAAATATPEAPETAALYGAPALMRRTVQEVGWIRR